MWWLHKFDTLVTPEKWRHYIPIIIDSKELLTYVNKVLSTNNVCLWSECSPSSNPCSYAAANYIFILQMTWDWESVTFTCPFIVSSLIQRTWYICSIYKWYIQPFLEIVNNAGKIKRNNHTLSCTGDHLPWTIRWHSTVYLNYKSDKANLWLIVDHIWSVGYQLLVLIISLILYNLAIPPPPRWRTELLVVEDGMFWGLEV